MDGSGEKFVPEATGPSSRTRSRTRANKSLSPLVVHDGADDDVLNPRELGLISATESLLQEAVGKIQQMGENGGELGPLKEKVVELLKEAEERVSVLEMKNIELEKSVRKSDMGNTYLELKVEELETRGKQLKEAFDQAQRQKATLIADCKNSHIFKDAVRAEVEGRLDELFFSAKAFFAEQVQGCTLDMFKSYVEERQDDVGGSRSLNVGGVDGASTST